MAMFQTLKLLPSHILGIEGELLGVLGFGLIGLILVALPFLDRRRCGGKKFAPRGGGIRDSADCLFHYPDVSRIYDESDEMINSEHSVPASPALSSMQSVFYRDRYIVESN